MKYPVLKIRKYPVLKIRKYPVFGKHFPSLTFFFQTYSLFNCFDDYSIYNKKTGAT